MGEAMSGLLADLFSTIDSKKRQLKGLLADPIETLKLGLLNFKNDQNALLDTQSTAYPWTGAYQQKPTQQQQAAAQKQLADQGANMGMAAATVWHGSPHKFDKFDSSKIGTGEGAQAYGHGLYLADSDKVAKQYADTLTDKAPKFLDGVPAEQLSTAQKSALGLLAEAGGNANAALLAAKTDMARSNGAGAEFHVARYNTIRDIARGKSKAQVGEPSLYKVDLPDEAIAKMLDWEKPLSQQHPDVQKALSQAVEKRPNMTGAELYNVFGGIGKLDQTLNTGFPFGMSASQQLKEKGIPGIRYLDGGSRGAGSGTSNYVIFPGNEDLLTILERNGQGLLGP